jgi:hypothetical protein
MNTSDIDKQVEEYLQKRKILDNKISLLQKARDYFGLINAYNKLIELDNIMGSVVKNKPKLAYVYIKTHQKELAENALQTVSLFDRENGTRIIMLLSLFMQLEEDPNLINIIKDTITAWLSNPQTSSLLKEIVFDFEDYL